MPAQYFQVLLRLLERDPTVKDLVGPRILTVLEEDQTYPCILLRNPTRTIGQTLAGPDGSGQARPLIDCLCDDYTDSWQLEQAVSLALDGFIGLVDGCRIGHCMHVGTQELNYDPNTGEEFPAFSKRLQFDVYHSQELAATPPTVDEPAGPPVNPPDTDPTETPTDPDDLPEWSAFTPSAEMVEEYGGSGPWDVGNNGTATYATPVENWHADSWWFWYDWLSDTPTSVADSITGLPNGRTINQGTLDRVLAAKANATAGFYTTLLRARTRASFDAVGVWPLTSAILTADYDDDWLDPAYNNPSAPGGDAWPEERGIAYQIAECRDVHGREWARNVANMKAIHPGYTRVFSDNFAMPQVASIVEWDALCLLAGRGNYHQRHTFNVALSLVSNVTTRWHDDLTADLDTAADNEIGGWHNEGLCHQHYMTVAQWNAGQPRGNQQYWMGLEWPGGGHRYFASNCRTDADSQLNRIVDIVSATPAGATLDIVLATPHRLSDSSIWSAFARDLHDDLYAGYVHATPHPTDPNRLTLNYGTTVPASGYGTAATLCFPFSGMDVDAAWLHSIRTSTSCCRATFVHGAGDSRGYVGPIWRTWAASYGYATGDPEKLSEHTVDAVACVKEIRTPFADGWYLHIDFSLAERRAWWAQD